jgi:long-subunit fatty acid transport protein
MRSLPILLAVAGTAHAGGFGIPEIGVRQTAMGSIIGRPDDLSSIYHNPAGLVLEPGWNVYVSGGVSFLSTQFELAPWDQSDKFLGAQPEANGYYAPVKPSRAFGVIPMIAASAEILPGKLYVGASVFVGNATGAAFDENAVTHYHLIDGYVVAPQGVVAAAWNFGAVAIGATVGVVNVRVHGVRNVFPIVQGNDISKITGTNPKLELDGSGYAPTWMLAAYGNPVKGLTWGATLTGRVDATLTGPVKVTYSDDSPQPGDVLAGSQTTNQLLPWAFMGGASYDVSPNVEVGADFRYWLYRQYKEQHTDIVGIFLVRALDTPKNDHDSWEASGGVRIHDLDALPRTDLMAGLIYDQSPAPPQTVTFDQPSFSHYGIRAGARYSIGRYRFGASYVHYWYRVPTVTDSITDPPSNFQGDAGNNIFTVSVEVRL